MAVSDEAQFLSRWQVLQLHALAVSHGIPVFCFDLRTDFQGQPFEGSTHLLALAEELREVKAECVCGRRASMTMRLNADGKKAIFGDQILIGGNAYYRQTCARCFYQ